MGAKGQRLELADAVALVRPRDTVACGFVSAQPTGFLAALGARDDLEEVVLYTGLLVEPYAFLTNPGVRCIAVSINTGNLGDAEAKAYLADVERHLGLPTMDPVRTGVDRIVDLLA